MGHVEGYRVCLAILFITHMTAFFLVFRWRKRFPLSKRKPEVSLVQIATVWLLGTFVLFVPGVYGEGSILCWTYNFVFTTVFHALFLIVILRILYLWNLHFQTQLILKYHFVSEEDSQSLTFSQKLLYGYYRKRKYFSYKMFYALAVLLQLEAVLKWVYFYKSYAGAGSILRGSAECDQMVYSMMKSSLPKFIAIAIALVLVLISILNVKENFGLLAEVKGVLVVGLTMLTYFVIITKISVNILNFYFFGFVYEMMWLILCIVPVLIWTYKFHNLHPSVQDDELHSSNHSSFGIGGSSSKNGEIELLRKILGTQDGYDIVHRFLLREFALENILLWKEVEALKENYTVKFSSNIDSSDEFSEVCSKFMYDSNKIVQEFITTDSPLCANLSYECRETILQRFDICKNGKFISNEEQLRILTEFLQVVVFSQREVLRIIAMDSYIRLKDTEEFKKFIEKSFASVTVNSIARPSLFGGDGKTHNLAELANSLQTKKSLEKIEDREEKENER
jgi:hypothetical protein